MADEGFGVAAVVLAGGASSRMGAPKPFVRLQGRWLIAHVLDRLQPQVTRTYVNSPPCDERLPALGLPIVPDSERWRGAGPLAGIAAAMAQAERDGFRFLVTAPCDAPFLPCDLVDRLAAPVASGLAPAAQAAGASGVEPLFALWPVAWRAEVERELSSGRASPRALLGRLGAAPVRFAAAGFDPFANLNSPQELAAVEAALASIPAIARFEPT